MSHYPALRLRRTRSSAWSRRLHAETVLTPADLIWPLFVTEGEGVEEPIASLPGVSRWSVDGIVARAKDAAAAGIPCLALFPNTPVELRTEDGGEALNPDNLMCRAIRAIKDAVPQVGVLTDVALDPYTSHGHDGVMKDGVILNDESVALLADQARVLAECGADVVAPSDMMDGRVRAIRGGLDAAGFSDVQILAYAA
ncbi:MAG: porphobilinogen synthase, partial [Sphingomonas sp.]